MVSDEDRSKFQSLVSGVKCGTPLALLVGAGISAGAGVPTAWRIVRILQRLKRIDKPLRYSDAMEQAFGSTEERRAFVERTFVGKPPAIEHFLLAHLAEKRIFRDILTTNFDHLIEIALAQTCSSPAKVYLHREALESIAGESPTVRVIKLHGDYLFDSLKNTDAETGKAISAVMRRKLSSALHGSGLLVAGYAGDDSVLQMLIEVAGQSGALSQGVWWIFHQPRHEGVNEADARKKEAERVDKFLSQLRIVGKCAELIRNANGISWLFKEISREVTGQTPTRPAFGIGSGRSLAPYLAGVNPEVPAGYAHPSDDPPYAALEAAIARPGVVLITGRSCAGKTRIVSRLICEHPDRTIFYFSFAFSRNNNPEDNSFHLGLGDFLEERSLTDARITAVERIFRHDGVVVLDDLPVMASSLSRGRAVSPGMFTAALSTVVTVLMEVMKQVGRGNLIVIRPPHLPKERREQLEGLLKRDFTGQYFEVPVQPDSYEPPSDQFLHRSLTHQQRRVLRPLAWLRFAEPVEVISRITSVRQGLPEILDDLVSRGIVAEHGGRYVLRLSHRFGLLQEELQSVSDAKLRGVVLRIAECFQKTANDPETTAKLHYLLEAENAYFTASIAFKANVWSMGTRMLAMAAPSFVSESPLWHRHLFVTITDYLQRVGDRTFDGLDLRACATLYSVFQRLSVDRENHVGGERVPTLREYLNENWAGILSAIQSGGLEYVDAVTNFLGGMGPDEWEILFNTLCGVLERRNPIIPRALALFESLEGGVNIDPSVRGMLLKLKNDLFDLKRRLKKHRRKLSKEDLQILGRTYLGLYNATRITPKYSMKKDLTKFVRYGRLAVICFRHAEDEIGEHDAKRYIGNAYMNAGEYTKAKKTLVPLLRRELGRGGFESFQAAEFNNLFCTFLGGGALRLAEGYFHEANYRYLRARVEGYIQPLATVGTIAAFRNPLVSDVARHMDIRNFLPDALEVAKKLAMIWADLPDLQTSQNLFKIVNCLKSIQDHYCETKEADKELAVADCLLTVLASTQRRQAFA